VQISRFRFFMGEPRWQWCNDGQFEVLGEDSALDGRGDDEVVLGLDPEDCSTVALTLPAARSCCSMPLLGLDTCLRSIVRYIDVEVNVGQFAVVTALKMALLP
jgi:hypothetical protein